MIGERVHVFEGMNPEPKKVVDPDAPDMDGEMPGPDAPGRAAPPLGISTTISSPEDLEARRRAVPQKRKSKDGYDEVKLRCLELASRGSSTAADDLIADARKFLDFLAER